jgi:hypothetical protein
MPHARSLSGQHGLLPASNKSAKIVALPQVPMRDPAASTIGAGTVVRIASLALQILSVTSSDVLAPRSGGFGPLCYYM